MDLVGQASLFASLLRVQAFQAILLE